MQPRKLKYETYPKVHVKIEQSQINMVSRQKQFKNIFPGEKLKVNLIFDIL
jgi:hypothetical protein